MGLVKRYWPTVAGPVLYGLGAATCIALLSYAALGHGLLSKLKPPITPSNIESYVRQWYDSLGLGIAKMPVTPDADFGFNITLKNGNRIVVGVAKERPNYLQYQTLVALTPEQQTALARLNQAQANRVTQEVVLELARSRVAYTIGGPLIMIQQGAQLAAQVPGLQIGTPMSTIILGRGVPMSHLDEAKFAGYVDEMDSAMSVAGAAVALALDHVAEPLPTRHN